MFRGLDFVPQDFSLFRCCRSGDQRGSAVQPHVVIGAIGIPEKAVGFSLGIGGDITEISGIGIPGIFLQGGGKLFDVAIKHGSAQSQWPPLWAECPASYCPGYWLLSSEDFQPRAHSARHFPFSEAALGAKLM